jgi:hypothetical protein
LRLRGNFRNMATREPLGYPVEPRATDMTLLKDIPTLPAKRVMLVGIPALLLAVAFSLVSHREAHLLGDRTFCGGSPAAAAGPVLRLMEGETPPGSCGASALAGALWTLGLAVGSFALLVRFPGSLFLMSLAFVNASARIPESVTVFLQYLINNKTTLRVDESLSLALIGSVDPAIPTVIMCFYSLLLICFTIIVVHNVKVVRYKWGIALSVFAAMTFIERGIFWVLAPFTGS